MTVVLDPHTPATGICLADDTPIPPAPSLGEHVRIRTPNGRAALVEARGGWVALCDCRAVLTPEDSKEHALVALIGHWETSHWRDSGATIADALHRINRGAA